MFKEVEVESVVQSRIAAKIEGGEDAADLLQSCSRCGGESRLLNRHHPYSSPSNRPQATCTNPGCEVKGPRVPTEVEAVYWWNCMKFVCR